MAAGAYTSVPDVIDYLYATIPTLAALSGIQVTDGTPGTHREQTYVAIGGGPEPDDETSAVRDYAVLGNGPANLEEEYRVELYIRAYVGGTDSKPPRDAAFAVFKAIEAQIRTDPNLGGNLSRHYPARLERLQMRQTRPENGSKGRVCELRTSLYVRHRY